MLWSWIDRLCLVGDRPGARQAGSGCIFGPGDVAFSRFTLECLLRFERDTGVSPRHAGTDLCSCPRARRAWLP